MLVDSHCHLHLLEYQHPYNNLEDVLNDCHDNHIEHLLCVAIDLQQFPEILRLAENHPNISISAGVHPNTDEIIPGDFDISIDVFHNNLLKQANNQKVIAIGETGLDYYRTVDEKEKNDQILRLEIHTNVAREVKKPLIIHTRNAQSDTIKYLNKFQANDVGGVMHCFTEDWEMAKLALDLGFYISISGIVSFKNAAQVQDVASKVPLDRLLIETDCPYLAPVPFRGKPNYPQYVKHVAEKIADLRNIDIGLVAEQTTANFYNLFGRKNGKI